MTTTLVVSLSFYGCSKENETAIPSTNSDLLKEATLNYSQPENTTYISSMSSLPVEELSEAEAASLIFMREEELLAHDVYLALSQLYTKPVFKNITKSEAVHTEAIRRLLVKYNLPDPAANHIAGTFSNPDLQALYNSLLATGSESLLKGLTVGATIEDLDIYDLKNHLLEVDNRDIIFVFTNLMNGSKNHLRAFYANIVFLGGTYTPQFITQEEFNAIINN
jgi:hypothetical protein